MILYFSGTGNSLAIARTVARLSRSVSTAIRISNSKTC